MTQGFKERGTAKGKRGDRAYKRKLSSREPRHLRRRIRKSPFTTLREIRDLVYQLFKTTISVRTAWQYVRIMRLKARKPYKKPMFNFTQRLKRVRWTKKYLIKPESFWRKVLYSDESRIQLHASDAGQQVYCSQEDTFSPECTVRTVKHGLSLTFRGAFHSKAPGTYGG